MTIDRVGVGKIVVFILDAVALQTTLYDYFYLFNKSTLLHVIWIK